MQQLSCSRSEIDRELPLIEECVTFQVALIGSDGLVVASDRKIAHTTPELEDSVTFENRETDKFYEDGAVICFYAGHDTAVRAAYAIVRDCQPRPNQSEFEWLGAVDAAAKSVGVHDSAPSNKLFVIRKDRSNCLWVVYRRSDGALMPRKVIDRACIGDNSTARFLVYQLWNRKAKVSELKRLALLTLSYASIESASSVGAPFDVMVMGKDGKPNWSRHKMPKQIHSTFDRGMRELFAGLHSQ
jgi:hypothetical protein